MFKNFFIVLVFCCSLDSYAATPILPTTPPPPKCVDEFDALAKAMNACPNEVAFALKGYKVRSVRHTPGKNTNNVANQKNVGDVVSITLNDSKNRPSGYVSVTFGAYNTDGKQSMQCKLNPFYRPITDSVCTMEARVCKDGEQKFTYLDSNGCNKIDCLPAAACTKEAVVCKPGQKTVDYVANGCVKQRCVGTPTPQPPPAADTAVTQ